MTEYINNPKAIEKVIVKIYNKNKLDADAKIVEENEYPPREIEKYTIERNKENNIEHLTIYFKDGTTATFENKLADLFIY